MNSNLQQQSRLTNLTALYVALLVVFLNGCSNTATGQRFLTVQIKMDDGLAFETKTGVADSMPVEKMWDVLEKANFEVSKSYAETLGNDSRTHLLKGKIVVEISHVGKLLASSTVDSLRLKLNESKDWVIEEGELDLVKQAAKSE